MTTILVTGGAGYIGSHAVYTLLDEGYKVVVVDNLVTGCRENLSAIEDRIQFFECDIANDKEVADILKTTKPDAVMHFAGSVVVPESVSNPAKYYRNNTMASLSLIENCIANDINHFIFSSTAAVYGIPEDGKAEAITEDTRCAPINPYGHSKLMTEQILADMAHAHPEFHYAALRYFNVAGADPKGRTGQSTPEATHLIKVVCQTGLEIREELFLFGNDYDTPDGTCIRDYIHVTDLAEAHIATLKHLMQTGESVVMNCGNGRGYSVKEVIQTFEGINGAALPVTITHRRAGDPPALTANAQKLQKTTGWKAKRTDLKEIVQSALTWEKKEIERHEQCKLKNNAA